MLRFTSCRIRTSISGALLLSLAAGAAALPQPSEDRSPEELLRAAQAGDAQAQYDWALHLTYRDEPDLAQAALWFRRAAEQGHRAAQFDLGRAYVVGRGVERDRTEGAKWFRLAAEQGHPGAQTSLGFAHEWGLGVALDQREAVKWYRRSAEQGSSSAQASLGKAYAEGKGLEKDEAEAVRWFRLSAEQHDSAGQYNLGEMYEAGRGVAKDEKEAAKWYGRAAEQNFPPAQTQLAEMYAQGRGVAKNPICAYLWYGLAAERGFSVGDEGRDTVAATLPAADLAEARRLVAKSWVDNGVLIRPLCPGERLSSSVTGAAWGEMLQMFRTLSGLEIEEPPGATGTVDLVIEDVTWETALTEMLRPKGYGWKREGDRIVIRPLAPAAD